MALSTALNSCKRQIHVFDHHVLQQVPRHVQGATCSNVELNGRRNVLNSVFWNRRMTRKTIQIVVVSTDSPMQL